MRWWLGRDSVWRARGQATSVATSTPAAAFGASLTGLTSAFDGSFSTDTGSTLTGYTWDFGDGTSGSGVKPTHTYPTSGTYTVMLTVTDALNNTDSTVTTVTVSVPLGHPTAAFSVATVNLAAQFNASASSDVGSTITSYGWVFGDGTTGTGQTVSHTYAAGTYTATLTVTDASGQTATVSHALTAVAPPVNQIPTAAFTTTLSGLTVSANGTASSDPDGTVVGYAWTWGDGTTSSGVTSTHTYAAAGTYTVTLTVTDNSGAHSPAVSKSVTVATVPTGPVTAAFTTSRTGLAVTADGRTSTAATPAPPVYYLNDAPAPTPALTFTLAQPSAMQCAVKSPDTGYWYVSQRTNGSNGTSSPYETLTVNRCDGTTGALVDSMTITNGGHGTGFALEYSGTTLYVWVALQVPASGGATWDIVRFPYQAGTYTRSTVPSLQVMFLNSQVGSGGKAHVSFDVPNGFCVTYDEITPTNTVYKRWVLSDFLAKKLTQSGSTVTTTFSNVLQGWAGVGDSLFVYTGGQNTASTDPIYLREYSFTTAKLTAQRDLTGMGANSDGTYPTGTYEPESLSVVQASAGATPRLYLGLTLGASSTPHTYPLYSTTVPGTNRVASYAWTWGDGATGSGATPAHTYAAAGAFTVGLTATDLTGATGRTSQSVTVTSGGGGSAGPVYAIGNYDDNIPTGVRVYTFADLGLSAGTTNLQTVVDALPAAGVIQLPNGYQGTIPNFAHHASNYGIYNSRLLGLIGGVDSGTGQLTAKITMAGNAMSSTQLATYPKRVRNSGNTTIGAFHTNGAAALYFGGIEFDGADQQSVVDGDGQETGPACWFGFSMNSIGSGSIFQNLLLRGFGKANDTTPPGEVGAWNETHSSGLTFRRVEHDGRLPNSTVRRSGGIQWNASTGSLLEDVYSHDAYYSGVTYSFTSMPSSSHDFTTRRLRVAHNSNHGNKNDAFAALNLEFNYGTNHHYQPRFSRDQYQNGSESHVRMWVYSASLGTADKNASHVFHQPVWDDSNSVDNGCFSIKMAGYTAGGGGFKDPTVYLTANESVPAVPYISTGGQVPSNITTANNRYVLKHN